MEPRGRSSRYIHGTAPVERERLARLNRLINDAAIRELALAGGERILDVGCGLGLLAREMARTAAGGARVVGIEASREQLDEAARRAREAGEEGLVELRHGDALALPLTADEWGSFDLVHARFLLEHVADPLAVVRGMVRAARPGGRIVLQDDGHDTLRLHPEPRGFARLWEAYWRSYAELGNDGLVGHRLVALLHEAGAEPVRNTWLFFGGSAGQATFVPLVENIVGILDGAKEVILAGGRIGEREIETTRAALVAFARRPDGAIWYAISWAEGRRP